MLSRVADAGMDYTRRSNKLAHHVVLDAPAAYAGGPAWLLRQPGTVVDRWEGEPGLLPTDRPLTQGDSTPRVCQTWKALMGDAGWAGVLAESAAKRPVRQAVLLFEPGMNTLGLVEEALAILPPRLRWQVTFSTYFTKLPPGIDCKWRFMLRGSPEAKAIRSSGQVTLIDLTERAGAPAAGEFVDAARKGRLAAVADTMTAEEAGPPILPTEAASSDAIRNRRRTLPARSAPEEWSLEARLPVANVRRPTSSRRLIYTAAAALLFLAVGGATLLVWGVCDSIVNSLLGIAPPTVPEIPSVPVVSETAAKEKREQIQELREQAVRHAKSASSKIPTAADLQALKAVRQKCDSAFAAFGNVMTQTPSARSGQSRIAEAQGQIGKIATCLNDGTKKLNKANEEIENARKDWKAAKQCLDKMQGAYTYLKTMGTGSLELYSDATTKKTADKINCVNCDIDAAAKVSRDLAMYLSGKKHDFDAGKKRIKELARSTSGAGELTDKPQQDPFEGLPEKVELPPSAGIAQDFTDVKPPVSIDPKQCKLSLTRNAIPGKQLELSPATPGGPDWQVNLTIPNGLGTDEVGLFRLVKKSLQFRWSSHSPDSQQLRNGQLILESGEFKHFVSLRTPIALQCRLHKPNASREKTADGSIVLDAKANIPAFPIRPANGAGYSQVRIHWDLPGLDELLRPATDAASAKKPDEPSPPRAESDEQL